MSYLEELKHPGVVEVDHISEPAQTSEHINPL